MKWFLIILSVIVIYAIYTGNMGGAKKCNFKLSKSIDR